MSTECTTHIAPRERRRQRPAFTPVDINTVHDREQPSSSSSGSGGCKALAFDDLGKSLGAVAAAGRNQELHDFEKTFRKRIRKPRRSKAKGVTGQVQVEEQQLCATTTKTDATDARSGGVGGRGGRSSRARRVEVHKLSEIDQLKEEIKAARDELSTRETHFTSQQQQLEHKTNSVLRQLREKEDEMRKERERTNEMMRELREKEREMEAERSKAPATFAKGIASGVIVSALAIAVISRSILGSR